MKKRTNRASFENMSSADAIIATKDRYLKVTGQHLTLEKLSGFLFMTGKSAEPYCFNPTANGYKELSPLQRRLLYLEVFLYITKSSQQSDWAKGRSTTIRCRSSFNGFKGRYTISFDYYALMPLVEKAVALENKTGFLHSIRLKKEAKNKSVVGVDDLYLKANTHDTNEFIIDDAVAVTA